ncbi:hypothetical protein HY439_01900 [Candidatus Microgenomates bacterium]|nr:hypothetical protein [Candidatus Microgenomates bacterium]
MVLGTEEILKLVKSHKLVTGLSDRELNTPEGAGFDLRLAEVWEVVGQGFLGIEERESAKLKLVSSITRSHLNEVSPRKSQRKKVISLKPGKYYVVKTVEDLNLPENIITIFRPRSTLYRSGVALFSGNASPGYCGGINVGLINFGPKPFEIEMGARFIHVIFMEVRGGTHLYRGQWQGGRTQTKGREKQV